MKKKDTIREISKNFNTMGRRFVKGDIVCILNDNLYHIYPHKEALDILTDFIPRIDNDSIVKILDNSAVLKELVV